MRDGLPSSATVCLITRVCLLFPRSAFRKVVLLVHPDKNHLEGSAAAFQKASEAFETLLEPARQRYYLRNLPRRFVTTTHRKRKRKHSDDDDNDDHTTASGHGGASGPSRQKPRLRRSDPKKRQSVDEFVRAVFADMRRQEEARANRSKAKQDGRRAQAEAVKRAAEARVLAEGGMERVEATARSWGMWKTATRSRVRVKGVVKRPRPVVTERGSAPPSTTGDSVVVVCTLCRRKFRSVAGLRWVAHCPGLLATVRE